jgi:hypothetical protein
MINNEPARPGAELPFHVEGAGRLWLETHGGELVVCYRDSLGADRKSLGSAEGVGRFDVSYCSSEGLEVKPLP